MRKVIAVGALALALILGACDSDDPDAKDLPETSWSDNVPAEGS